MKKGQSIIEYVLLAAISVVALVVGSNFVANAKKGGFETLFQSAKYRINNPGTAIVGTPFSTASSTSTTTSTTTTSTTTTGSTSGSGKDNSGFQTIVIPPTCFGGSCGKTPTTPTIPTKPSNCKNGGFC